MIQLDDEYFIDSDSMQYKLGIPYESVNRKTGQIEKGFNPCGYFNSLENALIYYKGIMIRKAVHEQSMTLSGAISLISNENKRLEKLIRDAIEGNT